MQPINGRLLVRVSTTGKYKHVNLGSDKEYENSDNKGEVLAVAPDLGKIIHEALKVADGNWIEGLIKPKDLVGKIVYWEKFAEQNTVYKITNPKTKQEESVALINYKDIVAYEG